MSDSHLCGFTGIIQAEALLARRLAQVARLAASEEREAILEIVAATAAASAPGEPGDKEWRAACVTIDTLIRARGVK